MPAVGQRVVLSARVGAAASVTLDADSLPLRLDSASGALWDHLVWTPAGRALSWTEVQLTAGRLRIPVRAVVIRLDQRAYDLRLQLATAANGMTGTWTVDDADGRAALALNAGQPDETLLLERALISRDADKSEWWRIKTISVSGQEADTITLESQFKPLDEQGIAMQVVRMRGKMPGDTEGKELIVPQQLAMLGAAAFPFKPTSESIASATVGTESIGGFSARHVKFGAGGGSMEWWLADNAPGGVVKVQFSGQDADEKWNMNMTGSGSGAKS